MNYELAKKLKDAGLPQGTTSSDTHYTYVDEKDNPSNPFTGNACYIPTLSELIEACGDDLIDLRRDGDGWAAISNLTFEGTFDPSISFYAEGTTPEEAVAMLYLAFNEKKV